MLRVVVLTQYQRVTDGRTDRQTDGNAIASTALAMRALRRAVKTVRLQIGFGVLPHISFYALQLPKPKMCYGGLHHGAAADAVSSGNSSTSSLHHRPPS